MKNLNIQNIVATVFTITILSACGGGGGNGNDDAFDGTANARYDGEWGGVCEFDDFSDFLIATLSIDGTRATIDFESYPTSDCSGNPSDVGQIVYGLDFVGTQSPSTGVCEIDDQVNTDLVSASANGNSLNSSELNLLRDSGIEAGGFPEFSLFCVNPDEDTLYVFDINSGDGSSEANRPTQIDDTDFITRTNSF